MSNIMDLSRRLLGALDKDHNIKDMSTIINCIALLERLEITKEFLSTTKLAKHINEMRKRTKKESLAKRAKSLLKSWREKVVSNIVDHKQTCQVPLPGNVPVVERSFNSKLDLSEINKSLSTKSKAGHGIENSVTKLCVEEEKTENITTGFVMNNKKIINEEKRDTKPVKVKSLDEDLKKGIADMTVEEILAQLPPIDYSVSDDNDEEPKCTCTLQKCANLNTFEFAIDVNCPAKAFYEDKHRRNYLDESFVHRLGCEPLPKINGNETFVANGAVVKLDKHNLFENVVPRYTECMMNITTENSGGNRQLTGFAEWYDCSYAQSYNENTLKMLPFVVID
ncbi:hypothetical protein WA026_018680 [Henosepilachna vigintioctopunctata]|uniref:Mediator of RNA polymerase II transcription subunit 26 n=1 Tax=Henosepilachna vigintioctopunctata TaxID=420089 RepID=A0AAW1UCC5_9CUCU